VVAMLGKGGIMTKARFVVVREAIEVLLRHVESLPPSDGKKELHAWVEDCRREAEHWSASPPAQREHDLLVRRLLSLHVEVRKLEREAEPAMRSPSAARVNPSAG
jgi:hypothetical protein